MFIFNALLYSFAILGLVTACWLIIDCINLYRGKESPPRGIPRPPRYGWVMEPAAARGATSRPQVRYGQLGAPTHSLLLRLYELESATFPKDMPKDPESEIPDDVRNFQGQLTAEMCLRVLKAINQMRAQRGEACLRFAEDINLRLLIAIDRRLEETLKPREGQHAT